MATEAFWSALRSFHASEAAATEDDLVARLERRWPHIEEAAFRDARKYRHLFEEMGDAHRLDPAASPIGLLDVVNRQRYEPYHTLVLSKLLSPRLEREGDPNAPPRSPPQNPLAAPLLLALLEATGPGADEREANDIAKGDVTIAAEKEIGGRLDLLIEIGKHPKSFVIVENKIGDRDREGQLDGYHAWGKAQPARSRRFVLLTPAGTKPTRAVTSDGEWTSLSYERLAVAFRRVLARADAGPWRDVLSLYLSSVMRTVLGFSLPAEGLRAQAHLVPYLEAALDVTSPKGST